MTESSDTPRTDAMLAFDDDAPTAWVSHARQLERELQSRAGYVLVPEAALKAEPADHWPTDQQIGWDKCIEHIRLSAAPRKVV